MAIISDYVEPIVSMALGTAQTIINPWLQNKTNIENREWQTQQNEITRRREDTAHQREVADLQAAGLSPLAATGGAATSTPIASEMEAPQVDTAAILDAMALNEQKREFDADLEERKATRLQDASQREKDREVTRESISASKEIAKDNREMTERITDKQIKLEVEKYNQNQDNLNIALEKANNDISYENMKNVERQSEVSYQNFVSTWGYVPSKEYTKLDEYIKARDEMNDFASRAIKTLSLSDEKQDPLTSASSSNSAGAGATGGAKAAGTGVSVGANITNSNGSSWTTEPKIERAKMTRRVFQEEYRKAQKGDSYDLLYPIFRATKQSTKKTYGKIDWK